MKSEKEILDRLRLVYDERNKLMLKVAELDAQIDAGLALLEATRLRDEGDNYE